MFYEFQDHLVVIPSTCTEYLVVSSCVFHETIKAMRFITSKYHLKRSTTGWYFIQVMTSVLKNIYSKATSQVYEQIDNFREYFYNNLFTMMYTFKNSFNINDNDALEDL